MNLLKRICAPRLPMLAATLSASVFGLSLGLATSTQAAESTIKIGVIGEDAAVAGTSITKAAQLAADEINAKGGIKGHKVQIVTYDDHSSAADAVRAAATAAVPRSALDAPLALSVLPVEADGWSGAPGLAGRAVHRV